jgi:hypothetical protein
MLITSAERSVRHTHAASAQRDAHHTMDGVTVRGQMVHRMSRVKDLIPAPTLRSSCLVHVAQEPPRRGDPHNHVRLAFALQSALDAVTNTSA